MRVVDVAVTTATLAEAAAGGALAWSWFVGLSTAQLEVLAGMFGVATLGLSGLSYYLAVRWARRTVDLYDLEDKHHDEIEALEEDRKTEIAEITRRHDEETNKNSESFKAKSLRLDAAEKELDQLRQVNAYFGELARQYAAADREIFNTLNLVWDEAKTRADISKATQDLICAHINATLDIVCEIIDELTGEKSIKRTQQRQRTAACVKVISRFADSSDVGDAEIATLFRDRQSYEMHNRGRHDKKKPDGQPYRVRDNTITIEVLKRGNPKWGDDNLKGLTSYQNANPDWRDLYGATLGVGIHLYEKGPSETTSYWAVLCVDNKFGNINNAACENVLSEVAQRLGALLHRLRILRGYPLTQAEVLAIKG